MMKNGFGGGLIFKGGGYGDQSTWGALRPRFHDWYNTTDQPRDLVPPVDGGLPKKPSAWKLLKSWITYHVKWLGYLIRLRRNP